MMRAFILPAIFFSLSASAAEERVSPPDLAITSVLASLLLVVACIFVFAYLMKQSNLLKNAKGKSQIKVVAVQLLSSKGRVQVIEMNGQQYLLGVTEQNITLLDKFAKPLTAEAEPEKKMSAAPFSTLLSKLSHKTNE